MSSKPHYAVPFQIPEADTSHVTRKMFDIPYANLSPAQKLDIYWPEEGNGPFPVILSIHGGAFMGGDKRDTQLKPFLSALERGYAVVGVNYRMSGEAPFPALIHDVKAAIRWVRANSETYMLDPLRIAVWGGSAGGYLALMAGLLAGVDELDDLSLGNPSQPENVQAVVAWFPPIDFLMMDAQLEEAGLRPPAEFAHSAANSPESLLLGEQITLVPHLVHRANPETYIRPGLPPFFIQHGDSDGTVPCRGSLNFAKKLDLVAPGSVTHEIIPGARHADPAFETPQNLKKVFEFLERALRS